MMADDSLQFIPDDSAARCRYSVEREIPAATVCSAVAAGGAAQAPEIANRPLLRAESLGHVLPECA